MNSVSRTAPCRLFALTPTLTNRWLGIWELFVNLSFCELVNLYQLVSTNHAIGYGLATHVLKLASKSLPAKTIASLTGISTNSVQRILTTNIHPHASRRLPINLCFDEFRSPHGSMSFICIDADTHKSVKVLSDRLNRTIKQFFLSQYSTQNGPRFNASSWT